MAFLQKEPFEIAAIDLNTAQTLFRLCLNLNQLGNPLLRPALRLG